MVSTGLCMVGIGIQQVDNFQNKKNNNIKHR